MVSSDYDCCKRYRKLIVLLIIVFLVSTVYTSQSFAVQVYISESKTIDEDTSCYNGYIIEFNEEPLSTFKLRIEDKINDVFSYLAEKVTDKLIVQKLLHYKNKILSLHLRAKEDISELVDNGYDSEEFFSREFSVLFNGIAIKKVPDVILEKIRDLPYVKSITPNYKIFATLQDSIPLIRADEVWELSDDYDREVTGKDVTIAVLDTGVDYTHPDLKNNFVDGYDFVNKDSDPMDDYGHGTHVAGIAIGVAPDAELYAYKVLNDKGEGDASTLMMGIEQAVSDPVDIISISAGDLYGHPDDALSVVADNAADLGFVVVAAVGNDGAKGEGTVSSPASARKVIGVGATDKNDKVLYGSSRGPTSIGTVKPDVVAPGKDIKSTRLGGGYTVYSGTSMACPHVSGTAALLLQMHPDWTPDEIRMALRNTAVYIGYSLTAQGYGRVDALEAAILPDAPPIAMLTTSGEINYGLIGIHGTASADDFQNYSLYYQRYNEWIKLYEGNEEVNNGFLFTWDTSSLNSGTYKLKLEVDSVDQTSVDIVYVTLKPRGNDLVIQAVDSVDEFNRFTINIKDAYGRSQMAWVLFTIPGHMPRLRYGSSVAFIAPLILNPQIESLEGKIMVFKIFGGYKTSEKPIRIVNKHLIIAS